jgi:predicted RNase H-like HicB family nuclease
MKNFGKYIAVIHKEKGSEYGVSFPDFAGCISFGKTLDEAKKNAAEALSFHIEGMLEDGEKIPAPTLMENIEVEKKYQSSIVIFIEVEPKIKAKKPKFVRFNVTMEEDFLEMVDDFTAEKNYTRSGLIRDALLHMIKSQNNQASKPHF